MPKIIDLRTRKKWRRNTVDRLQGARALLSREPGYREDMGFQPIGPVAGRIVRRLTAR